MDEPSSSYPSSSGGKKKRSRSPSHSDERPVHRTQIYTSLEDTLTFSDTMIALQLMRTQFPKLEKVVTEPFILQSQLYSSVKDRTQVDRDLESLKKDKVLRVFKLNTGQDDHAIMFMDDYLKQMALAVKRSRGNDQDGTEVFEWFERYVIHLKLEVSIDQRELCSLLSLGGDVTDKHITLLMNAGLLTRQLIDPNMYWFSIPSIGPVLKGLTQPSPSSSPATAMGTAEPSACEATATAAARGEKLAAANPCTREAHVRDGTREGRKFFHY